MVNLVGVDCNYDSVLEALCGGLLHQPHCVVEPYQAARLQGVTAQGVAFPGVGFWGVTPRGEAAQGVIDVARRLVGVMQMWLGCFWVP